MSASPAELLAEAERLFTTRATDLRGTWPRAVALLTRQALEQTLDDLWRWKAPGQELASRRAQLLCLGWDIRDEALAQEVRYAWAALSRACHHQPVRWEERPRTCGWRRTSSPGSVVYRRTYE